MKTQHSERYLRLAQAAAVYIDEKRVSDEKGVRWSIKDAFEGKHFCNDEISLYSGSAGIGKFFLNLYEATKEESLREDAVAAARYMVWRWKNRRALDKNFSLYAYTTGYAGVASYLIRIYELTGEDSFRDCVCDIVNACMAEAKIPENGQGRYWSEHPGIVGNAGTILFLLDAADRLGAMEWKQFAVEAGRFYLKKGLPYGGGLYYEGVDPAYFDAGKELIDPNFPMGTAGIGYLLLKLYEASGDREFLAAEEPIPAFEKACFVKQRKGVLLPHALPYRPELFYLGYCHGPVGTIRYIYEGWKLKKEEVYREEGVSLMEGLITSGAPRRRSDGFWNVHNVCCGTAGLVGLLTGLLADPECGFCEEPVLRRMLSETGEVLAEAAGRKILPDGREAAYWTQALDRVTPDRLSASIGYYEGAAGIADALLTLYQFENGVQSFERAVDDPFFREKK